MVHYGSNGNRSGRWEGGAELTRDGTAEHNSRDQSLRRERGQGKFIFPVQLTTNIRIGNHTRLMPSLLKGAEDANEHARSLAAFEEMLDFLVIRLSQASDALGPPQEEGELNSALDELSALMNGLAEDLVVESPAHRRALLRNALPKLLGAMLLRTYEGEPDKVFVSVQETLQGVARSLAKVLPLTDGVELEGACEALSLLFDKKQAFYRHAGSRTAGAGSGIPGVQGTELLSMLSEEDWRARVGFADWVDAVCSDGQVDVRRWRRAQVVEESPTGQLRLSYDGLSDYHDDWVNRDSPDIAPPGTRSGQEVERWRNSLQRGSLVDALDLTNTWTNATVLDTRERAGAPVVIGMGPMGGGDTDPSDRGHDLLISYRVYDPDGDFKEVMIEPHGPRDGDSLVPEIYASFAAQRQELEAMAAAATPGGLARRQLAVLEDAAAENAVGDVDPALDLELDLAEPGRRDGNLDSVAAPAAGGWGFAGRGHGRASGGVEGNDVVGNSTEGVRRVHRYFGLTSPDEWIPASSGRIEKVNSRAPLRNCWTEESPVNDKDDPYLTHDGQLVFAVQREPVDGGPCLVANIKTFGQHGGFENLIMRLTPLEYLPAPLAGGPPVPSQSQPPATNTPVSKERPSELPGEAKEVVSVSTPSVRMVEEPGVGKKQTAAAAAAGPSLPLEAMRTALVAVSSIRPLLARIVSRAIIDRTATAASAALMGACETELRGLTRERLDGIVNAFRELLKRGHRSVEAFRRVQLLQLGLALKLYSCPFMERKLQGLKIITDAVAAAATTILDMAAASSLLLGTSSVLTPQELVEWLDENKVVQSLFAGHTQLIRRSGDVVGFLCRQKALSAEHLDMIWAAGGGSLDKDRRICIHEVLRPLLYELDMDLLGRLVDKLRIQPADEVIEDTVTFIKDMAEATQQEDEGRLAIRLVDLLWAMTDDGSLYRPRIKAAAAECILVVTGLRGLRGHREQTLQRCVKNIRGKRSVVTSLKVMEAVLNHFPKEPTTYEQMSRSIVIHVLENEYGLTELLLSELESYVATSRNASVFPECKPMPSAPTPNVPDRDRRPMPCTSGCIANDEAHLSHVKARLHALEHFCDNSCLVLSTEQIKRLWACLGPGPRAIEHGYGDRGGHGSTGGRGGEVSTLLSWLSKACEACHGEGGGGMFEPDVAAELFEELIVSDGERRDFAAHHASPEWFACFQTFFFKVNRQAGRMCVETVDSDTPTVEAVPLTQTKTPEGPVVVGAIVSPREAEARRGAGFQNASDGTTAGRVVHAVIPRDPDAPLDMLVVPSGLSGMRALWNVALEAQDHTVADQATKLLNRTHEELAPALRNRIGEIREDYIRTCMAYIREGDEPEPDNDDVMEKSPHPSTPQSPGVPAVESAAHRQRSVVRALHLLEELVDETEKRGTGGLRAHGARVRGAKVVVLNFENKVLEPTPLPSTFKLEMHTNSEVWEVRRRVARMARMPVKSVELKIAAKPGDSSSGFSSFSTGIGVGTGAERRSVEALDRDNSRRLWDLGVRSDDLWVVTRRKRPAMPRVTLLNASGKLVPMAAAIFKKWFNDFENADGMMDRVGAANFIDSCCHDQCKPSDDRVSKFFRNYDADGDDLLTVNDFLRLFQDSCKDMPEVVWSNLQAHHYREDLTRAVDEDASESDMDHSRGLENSNADILPRSIISKDSRSVDRLLSVLSLGGPAAAAAWRFLMRLPTNPDMLKGVQNLEGFREGGIIEKGSGGCGKWKELLGPPGSHRMLYTLQIIHGVLDFVEMGSGGDGEVKASLELEDVNCTTWVEDFVRSGGLEYFCDAILSRGLFGDNSPRDMTDTQQACLALILKVVRTLLMGLLSISSQVREADLDQSDQATKAQSASTLNKATGAQGTGKNGVNGEGLWTSLPRDVIDAVLGAVEVSELQTRLVELAGVAADIANAKRTTVANLPPTATATVTAGQQSNVVLADSGGLPPLDLYGCVGEGSPADSMAQEALDLWAGVSRPPMACWRTLLPTDVPSGAVERGEDGHSDGCPLDEAVLKAIFCASDAIRVRLSQSLLQVCDAANDVVARKTDDNGANPKADGNRALSAQSDGGGGRDEVVQYGGKITPLDELREYVVKLLLENIPRPYAGTEEGRITGTKVKVTYGTAGKVKVSQPDTRTRDCTQLFHVLCTLVSVSIEAKSREGAQRKSARRFDVGELASSVVERLLAHPCTERRGSREEEKDTLLVGLLNLGLAVAEACPNAARTLGDGLVEALLDDFLFAPPTPASMVSEALAPVRPKCKTVASRAIAFKLLAALCKPKPSRLVSAEGGGNGSKVARASNGFDPIQNLQLVLHKGLNPLRKVLSKPDMWGYNPSSGERSAVGHVGLRNLGNTCYINSCLQQLFMLEPVRNGLLSLGEGDAEAVSLVAELQKLFGQLALSEKQAVDPSSFLQTMKDLDGNPIDVSVQQDAQGFLLDLFDKMEAGLKSTPQSSLLMSTFGGTQITQLICPKRPSTSTATAGAIADTTADTSATPSLTLEEHDVTDGSSAVNGEDASSGSVNREELDTRERGETFMCLSLEVKNMVGVEDALEKFTEKEVIEGYAWDDERRDESIHRRTVLGKLPPNVVLHLNRFKMNLDTFQTEKINTRFDFPTKLDLEPFTKEGLAWRERVEAAGGRGPEDAKRLGLPGSYEVHPRSYYTYRLRGVVVHTGTANQGHYFSYIREPNSSSDGSNGGNWVRSSPLTPAPPAAGSPSTTSLSFSVDGSAGSAAGDEAKEGGDGGLEGGVTPTASPSEVSSPDTDTDGRVVRVDGIIVDGDVEDGEGKDSWCEFNDTIVKEWRVNGGNNAKDKDSDKDLGSRMSGLEADCFGGQQNMQETDEYGWSRKIRKDNIQNAYLLFYERVDQNSGVKCHSTPDVPVGDDGNSSSKANAASEERHRRTSLPLGAIAGAREAKALRSMAAAVPPVVFRSVWDDNNKFLLDRQLYHPDMSSFVLEVLSAVREVVYGELTEQPPGIAGEAVDVATVKSKKKDVAALRDGFLEWGMTYALDNLARAMENNVFPRALQQLQGLYDLNPQGAGSFLDSETEGGMQKMREMLLQCPDRSVRVAMKDLVLHLLAILAEPEGDRYLHYELLTTAASTTVADLDVKEMDGSDQDRGRPCSRLGRMISGWLGLLPDAARSWNRFEQFLELIEGVSDMGDRERDLLLYRRMVCRLSSFFLQDKSPVLDPKNRLPKMGHKSAPPRFSPLVRCLKTLRAHSGETARWQPRGAGQAESESDTAYDSEGSRSDDSVSSMTAVKSMSVGQVISFHGDEHASEAKIRHRSGASAAVSKPSVWSEGVSLDTGDGALGGVVVGGMTAKERARSLTLSPNCRRCLNCETLYDLAFEEQHAPEAAAELMCSWAADSSKLLRPLSSMIVQGVDTTAFVDLDSWLLALRSWLEVEDTLKEERLRLVLGTGKQEAEPKLLLLMIVQKDKYEKWLFRVLLVLTDLLVSNPAVGSFVSKIHSHEMLPWADWITKHLNDTYGSIRGVGPSRVKEEELVQIKENLRMYELMYHGRTGEDRLLEMTTKAKLGPAEGEPGITRIESLTSNGVQVEMLDLAAVIPDAESTIIAGESPPGAWRRFWRVTNHRMDSVNFTFNISPTPPRLETVYPYRRPNYHIPPPPRDIKVFLKPRDSRVILEVDKIDHNREFGPWPFKWVFEAAQIETTDSAQAASDLLQQQAQLEGDLGDAARVALEAERQEEAEAASKAEEEMAQAVAAAAASLPVVPMEVVSKVNADGAAASLEGKVGEAGPRGDDAPQQRLQILESEEETFWESESGRDGMPEGDPLEAMDSEGRVNQKNDLEDEVTVLFDDTTDGKPEEDSTDLEQGTSPDGEDEDTGGQNGERRVY